jgi:DNA-binding CsgD family transcriptional regulator
MSPNRAHPPADEFSPAFRVGLQALGAAAIVATVEGLVLYANEAAANLIGRKPQEAGTRPLSDILAVTQDSMGEIAVRLKMHKVAVCHVDLRLKDCDLHPVGINCLLTKDGGKDLLLFLIHTGRGRFARVAGQVAEQVPVQDLTDSEVRVLVLVAEGLLDKEVAGLLHVKVWTVSRHVSAAIKKLQVASRTEASVRALREGLIC